MKKLILFLITLFVGISSVAQYSPSNNLNYIKLLKVPPAGSAEDSVMVFDGSDGFLKMRPKSIFVTKESLGLGNVDNTSDVNKPISISTQNKLDMKLNISDLPTNLVLYPTTAASDVSGYVKMVTDIHASDYNTTAVDVSTASITGTAQLVSQRISDAGVLVGQPGVFNITTFGNIKRLSGTGTAAFYFEVYHRDAAGVETLICTSSVSEIVSLSTYTEFTASGIWNDGDFVATDRIVIKTYANRIAGGTDPVYQFQFGGTQPVRTLLPVPFSVVDAGYELKANKQNSLEVDGTGTKYPTVDAVNAALPKTYTTTVYVNTNDPNTATVFDDENPPVTNDDALKTDTANLYIGNDASTWVYNGSTYVTKTIPSTSNFFIRGTTADAGNSKTENIERIGNIKTSGSIESYEVNAGNVIANNFIKSGGTSSQFLKANGSVDSNAYATQDGTILYHSVKWFTPSGTVSSVGATVTSAGTQFTSAMIGAKLIINGEQRIITGFTSSTVVTVDSAYSTNYSGVAIANWGVYSKSYEIASNGFQKFYGHQANNDIFLSERGSLYVYEVNHLFGRGYFGDGVLAGHDDYKIVWSNGGNSYSPKDVGLRRNSAGVLEIYDGVTADGAIGNRRDLLARNYTGSATLTDTPTAPTATAGTNTTQIATTAFVQAANSSLGKTLLLDKTITTYNAVSTGAGQTIKTWVIPANTIPADCILKLTIKTSRLLGSGNPFMTLSLNGSTGWLNGQNGNTARRNIIINDTTYDYHHSSGGFIDDILSPAEYSNYPINRTIDNTLTLKMDCDVTGNIFKFYYIMIEIVKQ